jgi:hypothetical protein
MKLPPLQGTLDQPGFFIYAAADATYFDEYAVPLINSVIKNTPHGIHIHIYNPRPDQIERCQNTPKVSVTWETFDETLFKSALKFWTRSDLPDPYLARRNRMLGTKVVNKNLPLEENLAVWLKKTYYACVRFIRLAELVKQPRSFLAIDVDGIVRSSFQYEFDDNKDFYLHVKEKGGHLAGVLLGTRNPRSVEFIQRLANDISREFEQDNIYWFLDQYCLDNLVDQYNKGYLPLSYIDWHMKPESAIWSAKGRRKELAVFKQEQDRYR